MTDKRILHTVATVAVAAFAATLLVAAGQPWPGSVTPEQEVGELLNQLRKAQLLNNVAQLERIYADDYTLTEDDGTIFTKSERIAAINELHFVSSDIRDVKIRVYNEDAAVINYKATVRFRDYKPDTAFSAQVTSVCVKMLGQWRLVASHESPLAADR